MKVTFLLDERSSTGMILLYLYERDGGIFTMVGGYEAALFLTKAKPLSGLYVNGNYYTNIEDDFLPSWGDLVDLDEE